MLTHSILNNFVIVLHCAFQLNAQTYSSIQGLTWRTYLTSLMSFISKTEDNHYLALITSKLFPARSMSSTYKVLIEKKTSEAISRKNRGQRSPEEPTEARRRVARPCTIVHDFAASIEAVHDWHHRAHGHVSH
uniref:Secreted protein n=1 Tax=Opuntia streptacantha TaxID=393608 RepID=A0A7C9CXP6_OPUST